MERREARRNRQSHGGAIVRHEGYRSYMSRADLDTFARRWPCYDGPRAAGWAEFDRHGDLVDLSAAWHRRADSSALAAIIDDMRDAREATGVTP